MKKTIWFILLSLFVWSGTAQVGWGAQDTDNPFPPVLPNPPELPSTEKQEKQEGEKDGPIVIDLTRPAAETPNQAQEQLSELRPNQAEDLTPPQPEPDQDQKILVREKFAGWNEAGTGTNGNAISEQLRANWVMLSNNGLLQGRVLGGATVNAAKVPVYLLSRGKVLTQTRTDADGNFSFNNVQQGTYSLIGFGQDAFFAFGFNAIDYAESIQFRMPDKLLVRAVQNKTTINLDWIRYFAPNLQFRVYGRFVSQQGSKDPANLYGVEGISIIPPQSAAATSIQAHPVSLTEDGTLVGRVHQIDELNGRPVDVRGVRAILIQDDKVFGAASTDNYGVFSISGVTPGFYSIVAVGNDGMGCIGIEVVANASENARPVDFALVAPETAGWLNHIATEVAYQRIVGRPRDNTTQCQQCGTAMPPTMNGVCGQCGVCQECGVRTFYGMCGGCGTGCSSGHGGCFGGGMGGGYGGGYGGGGYGSSSSKGMRQFWRDVNAGFDICFYGETFAYGSGQGGQGGYGGYGQGGYGQGGYGQGGYGQGGYGGYGQGGYGYGGAPYGGMPYGGGYGMNPNYPAGGYPMQDPYYGMPYNQSLPNVYAPVVPEVPMTEGTTAPMVPTPAEPHIGH